MSKLIDEAMEVLRTLPEDVQAAAARAILDYGADHDHDLRLSDAQAPRSNAAWPTQNAPWCP